MKNNEEKDNKIKILENKYNELKKEIILWSKWIGWYKKG